MSKRTSRTEYLVLVVAVRRTETHDSPSSSAFAAADPVDDSKPGLAKVEPKPFPFKLKAGGQ